MRESNFDCTIFVICFLSDFLHFCKLEFLTKKGFSQLLFLSLGDWWWVNIPRKRAANCIKSTLPFIISGWFCSFSSDCGWCCFLRRNPGGFQISWTYFDRFCGTYKNGREQHCISGWVLIKVDRDIVGSSCWLFSWFPWVRQLGRWQSRRWKVCSLRPPRRSSQIRGRGRWTRERSWGQRRQQRVTWGAGWCTWSTMGRLTRRRCGLLQG